VLLSEGLAFVAKTQQHCQCDDRYGEKIKWRKTKYSQHTQQKNNNAVLGKDSSIESKLDVEWKK
jgi:hypothetical protein